jgi:long-subunit fatty acid transport protein
LLAGLALALVAGGPAAALSILLNAGSGVAVATRLAGLGHSVTVSTPASWTASFDYSVFDVVAFEFSVPAGSANPGDIGHLVGAVDAGAVGVVFFRGYGAGATAAALGVSASASDSDMWYQNPALLTVLDDSHAITAGMSLGTQDLGFEFMSRVIQPGVDTAVLASGAQGAALVAHQTRRVAVVPFFGHPTDFADETPTSIALTERALQWAASSPVNLGESGALGLLGLGLAGVGLAVRRRPS